MLEFRAVFGVLAILAGTSSFGQGTAKDYENANRFGERFSNKVLNERLESGWISDGAALWFSESRIVEGSAQKTFFVIDQARRKRLAFDHDRLATALSSASGQKLDPRRLPFRNLQFSSDLTSVELKLDKNYRVDLSTYMVAEAKRDSTAGLVPSSPRDVSRSGGGGEQTNIQFVNQSKEDLKVLWLMDDGTTREYKVLKPGEEWGIQTWETHYWLVTRVDGTKLAVYMPSRNGGTAYLDGKVTPPRRRAQGNGTVSDWSLRASSEKLEFVHAKDKSLNFVFAQPLPGYSFSGEFHLNADRTAALCFTKSPETQHPLNIVQTTPPDVFQPRLTSRQYLKPGDDVSKEVPILVDLRNRKVLSFHNQRTLFSNPFEIGFRGWLDTDRATILYNERGHQNLRLLELSVSKGTVRPLIDENSKTFIDWTAKSDLRILENKQEAIFQSERSGWSHYYLYDLNTGKVKNPITQGNWVVRGIDRVDEEKRQVWFRASGLDANQDPYQVHFCRVNFDGTGLVRLTQGNGNHRVEYSPDGKLMIDTYSRPDMAPVHELRSADNGKLISELCKSDATNLLKLGFKMPRVFKAKGRDGVTDIWGHVYFPTNFDPSKKYPVVEDIYAGPHSSHVPKNFHSNAGGMQMAELGFIVVRIDGMGTSNRSKAFHDVCWKNIVDAGFPDRILWMNSVAQQIPAMDLSRVGIYGTSAGGQNTLHALLTQGDFYKVGVADCGCYDNRMDKIWWNEQWMGWPIGNHYEEQSGRTLAKNLKGKLLLLLGEMDTNVDPASTYQVVDALIKANKDFDFVSIPNVGHGAVGHPYGRRKLQDFLVRNLLKVEPRN
jgi:dipeptidyl-peptidase 4